MTTPDQAVRAYQATTAPTAIRRAVRAAKRCGHDWINAAVVRQSAVEQLISDLEAVR